ncbi:MAG: type VI secretion system ATPase TssH, partial [Bacteroidales bacterium]|nr:type VI secretion system ATPase TssH [Bacteroidales bacterium]
MNPNQLTIKVQEALQTAIQTAASHQSQAVTDLHLLHGMFQADDHILPFLLKKAEANPAYLQQKLNEEIGRLPSSTGTQPYLNADAEQVFNKAQDLLKSFGDEYITLELLLIAMLNTDTPAGRLLKAQGLDAKTATEAVKELRKGQTAKDANAEDTYQALGKYAKNL